jgi:phosphatidylserine/phosphatidylglycerophosphate/cardiolipin synthase-like enzyme
MWGGSGSQPIVGNSKFSSLKLNNTPKQYTIGGVPVEAYFSPTDGVTDAIKSAIQTTDSDLDFALLVLTRDDLTEAIIEEDNLFLVVARGMIEQVSGLGSDFQTLLDGGVDTESHEGIFPQLHHKYCIIDHSSPDSDPLVITGSHNWSSSAETVNDENTVIIHDASIANQFYQEWHQRWSELTVGVEEVENQWDVRFYPNPASDIVNLYVNNTGSSNLSVSLLDIAGKEVYQSSLQGKKHLLDVSAMSHGVYTLMIHDGHYSYAQKLVIR